MKITEKMLSLFREEIDEYEKQLNAEIKLNKKQDQELLIELSYIDGKRDMLIFLKHVLEDTPNAIAIVNEYLKED